MGTFSTLTFPGQFESLAAISEFVTDAARTAGLDACAVDAVQLAVDEACSNIVEHAYGGERYGDIECTCHINDDSLTIIIRDHGHPFDPSLVPEPDTCPSLDDETCTGGGLGLYFMRQLMDKVVFEFAPDSGNVVTMVKLKEPTS
ncbi:MAG: ATP-binding protein [Chloroflexi bacterium]|nr:ATP-binding protein [Chloroflexota bacterium]